MNDAGTPLTHMHALTILWLPVLLSAVAVFVISALIHMVIKWHSPDYRGFSNEEAVRGAIRAGNPTPGHYVVPNCGDMKQMNSEAMQRKYIEGPVAHIIVAPSGRPNMGKHLGLWFLWTLVISASAAVIVGHIIPIDPIFARKAAKIIAALTFVAYGYGSVQESIWTARPWVVTIKNLVDAAIYGVATGFVFYWLWP